MQPDRFTIKSQEALQAAQALADQRRNPQTTPEHLLAVLLEQDGGVVAPVLRKLGVDGSRASGARSITREAAEDDWWADGLRDEPAGGSSELVQILRAAETAMRDLKDDYVSTRHLLLALSEHPGGRPGQRCVRTGATHDEAAEGARGGARLASRDRSEPRGEVPGAGEVRPRPDRGRERRASSTR